MHIHWPKSVLMMETDHTILYGEMLMNALIRQDMIVSAPSSHYKIIIIRSTAPLDDSSS